MNLSWEATGLSDVGRVRLGNEDAFRIDHPGGIFVLADGMGGHAAGEVASRIAADAALEILVRADRPGPEEAAELLPFAFRQARDRIQVHCQRHPSTAGMGTTLIAAILSPGGILNVAHIGDSRLYHLTSDSLRQLTRDHTWVQQEVDAGRVSPDAARTHPRSHILTRVLTADDPPDPDVFTTRVFPGDLLLLCSDGLYNMVSDADLLSILLTDASLHDRASQLIATANEHGGADNVTAIVVRLDHGAGPAAG